MIDYVASILESYTLETCNTTAALFGSGSTNLRTYLPESDVDLILCAQSIQPQGQPAANGKHTNPKRINIFTIFNALCQEVLTRELEPHSTMTIRNVEFINARTKVANCKINNLSVDITLNQTGALASAVFLEEADRLIGMNHLFKRSLLLIKVILIYN